MNMSSIKEENIHWYAFHCFRNGRAQFINALKAGCVRYYLAEQVTRQYRLDYTVEVSRKLLFPSIVFVHTTPDHVNDIMHNPSSQVAPYTNPGTKEPAIISDTEMETFMFVLDTGCEQMDIVDEKLAKGDRVRVLDGVFKGAEGYIVRIKGDRRFVVALQGVAAVATSYIPQKFIEKIS